jgi:hypothetical protein
MDIERDILVDPWDDWRDVKIIPNGLLHKMVNGRLFVFENGFANCYVDVSMYAILRKHSNPKDFGKHKAEYKLEKCFWAKHPKKGIHIFHRMMIKNRKKKLRLLADIVSMEFTKKTTRPELTRYLKDHIIFEPRKGKKRIAFFAEYQQYLDDKSGKYQDFSVRTSTGLEDTDSEEDD